MDAIRAAEKGVSVMAKVVARCAISVKLRQAASFWARLETLSMLLLVKNLINISVLAIFCPVFGQGLAKTRLGHPLGF
jgi:hypothetical protein